MRARSAILALGFGALAAIFLTESTSAQSGVTQTIAQSGVGGVPGVSGANFSGFSAPNLNLAGEVAFSGALQTGVGGVTSSDDVGLWGPDAGGNLSLIAREGVGGVPGVAGANFSGFSGNPVLNGAGETAFLGSLQTGVGGVTSSNNTGIWGPDSGGNLSLIAREGVGGVPGVAGANFSTFIISTVLNGAGETTFQGILQTGAGGVALSNDRGFWGPDSGGNLSLIAREGVGGVPGVSGANFSSFGDLVLNGAGETAFYGTLQTGVGGVTSSNDTGIWGPDSGGNLSLVAREGVGGVPGVAGANFSSFGNPVLNGAGETAFYGTLQTGVGGVTSSNDTGIWGPDSVGNLSLIAREGVGGVPGVAGASFSSFNNPVLNGAGETAFVGLLQTGPGGVTSSNDSGVWGPDSGGNLSLIAREGVGGVPGVAGASFSSFNNPVLNGAGETAFYGLLQTGVGGVTSSNDYGIWIGDGVELVEVQRKGNSLAGGTVTGLALTANSGGEDGRGTGLNDYGQIAYRATLATGEGVFLWTPTLHWRGTAGDGQWDSRTNFTLSTDPAQVHEVILDPASSVSITGGAGSTTVSSLQIGGGAGSVGLVLQPGSNLSAPGGVTVANNGTLSGTGTVTGNLVVGAGGTLSPGNSPGTMSVVGNVTWAPSGTELIEVNDALGASGADPGWDLLDATGTLTITASAGNEFTLGVDSLTLANAPGNAANFNPANSYSWTFASAVGGIVGFDPAAFLLDLSGFTNPYTGTFSVAQMGSNLNLLYTPPPAAVPEPGTLVIWSLLGTAVGAGAWRRRRQRAR